MCDTKNCSDIWKKISVDFQNASGYVITYMLTHHTVQYLDFLFHVDLRLCSETHSSTSLCERSEADVYDSEDSQGSELFQEITVVSRKCYLEESQKLLLRVNFTK